MSGDLYEVVPARAGALGDLSHAVAVLEAQGWAPLPLTSDLAAAYAALCDDAAWFFGLAREEKAQLDIRNSHGHRGWVPTDEVGSYDDEGERRYEAFDIGRTPHLDDRHHHPLRGMNRWPQSARGEAFGRRAEAMFAVLSDLAVEIGDAVCAHLGVSPETLRSCRHEPVSQLRLIRYAAPSNPDSSGSAVAADRELAADELDDILIDLAGDEPVLDLTETAAMGAHTDYEFFTLLYQSSPGTQVIGPCGEWVDLPCDNTLVLFAGDMLSAFSGGRFESVLHRAGPQVEPGRVSIPFFAGADFVAHVRPVVGHSNAPIAFGDHLMTQLRRDFPYLRNRVSEIVPGHSSFELDALARAELDPADQRASCLP